MCVSELALNRDLNIDTRLKSAKKITTFAKCVS